MQAAGWIVVAVQFRCDLVLSTPHLEHVEQIKSALNVKLRLVVDDVKDTDHLALERVPNVRYSVLHEELEVLCFHLELIHLVDQLLDDVSSLVSTLRGHTMLLQIRHKNLNHQREYLFVVIAELFLFFLLLLLLVPLECTQVLHLVGAHSTLVVHRG